MVFPRKVLEYNEKPTFVFVCALKSTRRKQWQKKVALNVSSYFLISWLISDQQVKKKSLHKNLRTTVVQSRGYLNCACGRSSFSYCKNRHVHCLFTIFSNQTFDLKGNRVVVAVFNGLLGWINLHPESKWTFLRAPRRKIWFLFQFEFTRSELLSSVSGRPSSGIW